MIEKWLSNPRSRSVAIYLFPPKKFPMFSKPFSSFAPPSDFVSGFVTYHMITANINIITNSAVVSSSHQ